MEILRSISSLQTFLQKCRKQNGVIGFVPTMGALHKGHLSLLSNSIRDNDYTICSIYINPKQFDKKEDLINYPNTLDADLKVLKSIGCDYVFTPSIEEVYQGQTTYSC